MTNLNIDRTLMVTSENRESGNVAQRWMLGIRVQGELASTLIAQSGILALGAFTGIVAARLLGPQGRGELVALTIWPLTLVLISSLGINQAIVFCTGKKRLHIVRDMGGECDHRCDSGTCGRSGRLVAHSHYSGCVSPARAALVAYFPDGDASDHRGWLPWKPATGTAQDGSFQYFSRCSSGHVRSGPRSSVDTRRFSTGRDCRHPHGGDRLALFHRLYLLAAGCQSAVVLERGGRPQPACLWNENPSGDA